MANVGAPGASGLGYCPFSWIQVSKPPGCLGGLMGGQAQLVNEPQTCMSTRCQLWDGAQGNCGLITRKS